METKCNQAFKVRAGVPDFSKTPVPDWTIEQFVRYYEYQHEKIFGFKTTRTRGQIKIVINLKTLKALYRYYGKNDISIAELFKQYLDSTMLKSTPKTFKFSSLSSQNHMTEYLDNRVAETLGSLDDFKKQEEAKKKEAEDYYRKLGWKPDDDFKF